MTNSRQALQAVTAHVDESMGMRADGPSPRLAPVPLARDMGRQPRRDYGQVEVARVIPDPSQPRTEFAEQELQRLAANLRSKGQLHPIRVRWDESANKWVIITGERRWRAAQLAGWEWIDCHVHQGEPSPAEILEQQLIENLLREDLRPLEEARGYDALMKLQGWNGKQAAAALHVSPSKVSRALALLDLPEAIQRRIEAGDIPRVSAYEIAKLKDGVAQENLAAQAAQRNLTQRQTASAARQRHGRSAPGSRGMRQTFLAENGLTVTVTARRKATYPRHRGSAAGSL